MEIVYGAEGAVMRFVREVYGRPDVAFPGGRAIGVAKDGRLVAGVVFHDWNPAAGTIELSIAATSRRWLTRPVMAALARYVVDGAHAQLAVMRASERNRAACRIAEAIGFTPHRIPRLRGPDEAEIIFTMTADDLRRGRFTRAA